MDEPYAAICGISEDEIRLQMKLHIILMLREIQQVA